MRSKGLTALLMAFSLFGTGSDSYRLAVPGYRYSFPADHFNHPEFQTEWWYYTGNLHSADGRRFGFELTFFRHGVDREPRPAGVWDVRDVWLAHLALSDLDGSHFFHTERLNRAGPGIAGADLNQGRVWNGNWQVRWKSAEQQLNAVAERFSIDLSLRSEKPPVIHGIDGVSQKSEGAGRASHYISLTHLISRGSVTIDGKTFSVEGLTWMDHEFFTHQLEANQSGWDWFSLQFEDGTELMLFRIRRKDGSADPFSAGTYVDATGRASHLAAGAFSVAPGKTWRSPDTGGEYPIEWKVQVPPLQIDASLSTRLPRQELTGKSDVTPAYWEGAIEVKGTKGGRQIKGAGYLEMTGYAAPVRMGV
jgi:predicted secreted hydrolase